MGRKGYFIISAILFVLAIGLVVWGALMFNALPEGYIARTSTKYDLMCVGLAFCFISALGCFAGAIGMLASGLSYRENDW